MSSIKNIPYPMNLLAKIGNGRWNYKLPDDIDSTIRGILLDLGTTELNIILSRFKYKKTCKEISEKFTDLTENQVVKIADKTIRKIRSVHMQRLIMGDKKYGELMKSTPVLPFNLAIPFRACVELRLRSNNINSLEDLLNLSYDDLIKIPHVGEKTANDIIKVLSLNGYTLGQSKNPSLFHEYCKRLWEI